MGDESDEAWFEGRKLKPYAEPVKSSELQCGSVYFIVAFDDNEMLIPEMRPVVFVGTDLEGEGKGRLYFQDYASYKRGARHGSASREDGPIQLETAVEGDVGFLFEYERGLEVLLACSLRRRRAKNY